LNEKIGILLNNCCCRKDSGSSCVAGDMQIEKYYATGYSMESCHSYAMPSNFLKNRR